MNELQTDKLASAVCYKHLKRVNDRSAPFLVYPRIYSFIITDLAHFTIALKPILQLLRIQAVFIFALSSNRAKSCHKSA